MWAGESGTDVFVSATMCESRNGLDSACDVMKCEEIVCYTK